jgi:hypothetical protein
MLYQNYGFINNDILVDQLLRMYMEANVISIVLSDEPICIRLYGVKSA